MLVCENISYMCQGKTFSDIYLVCACNKAIIFVN